MDPISISEEKDNKVVPYANTDNSNCPLRIKHSKCSIYLKTLNTIVRGELDNPQSDLRNNLLTGIDPLTNQVKCCQFCLSKEKSVHFSGKTAMFCLWLKPLTIQNKFCSRAESVSEEFQFTKQQIWTQ